MERQRVGNHGKDDDGKRGTFATSGSGAVPVVQPPGGAYTKIEKCAWRAIDDAKALHEGLDDRTPLVTRRSRRPHQARHPRRSRRPRRSRENLNLTSANLESCEHGVVVGRRAILLRISEAKIVDSAHLPRVMGGFNVSPREAGEGCGGRV